MLNHIMTHETYGPGTVLKTRANGRELFVKFERGGTRWIWRDEFESGKPITQQALSIRIPTAEQAEAPVRISRAKDRRMIHAFRLGIVPEDCVAEFTFGREREIAELLAWLHKPNDSVRTLFGQYGSGKTHLLNNLRQQGIDAGYAVATVEMDAKEVPFHRPKQVYHRLVQSLRYRLPAEVTVRKFRDLLRHALNNGLLLDHVYFQNLHGNTFDEALLDWIEASDGISKPLTDGERRFQTLPGLYDHANAANIFCYLLSGLGWAAKRSGLKGLLLIFDEAESMISRMPTRARQHSLNFFSAMIQVANDNPQLLGDPAETNLFYSQMSSKTAKVPFLYRQPSGLKLLFTFASEGDVVEEQDDSTDAEQEQSPTTLQLYPLEAHALRRIFEQIVPMYDRAYGLTTEYIDKDELFETVLAYTEGSTRRFVKGCIEALDLIRFHPNTDINEVLQ